MFKEIRVSQSHIKTRRREKVYGVGVNDAPYYTSLVIEDETFDCPYYTRWKKMLSSCYSVKNGSGLKKSVCNDWLSFMTFRRWMEQQAWQGRELTHWLRVPGSTIYSPVTCLFVTKRVRSLFPTDRKNPRVYPQGIKKGGERFIVHCSSGDKKQGYIGSYPTLDEAIDVYIQAKVNMTYTLAQKQQDPITRQALLNYIPYFSRAHQSFKTNVSTACVNP